MLKQYLIKDGTLLSVMTGEEKKADIRVKDGIVTEIAPALQPEKGEEVISAAGMTITTGWVDAHCHFGVDPDGIGIEPMEYVLSQGVTYALDPGTAGARTFELFRRLVRYRSDLKYKAYINMGSYGMHDSRKDTEGPEDVEHELIRDLVRKYPDEIAGLKIRIDPNFCFDSRYMLETTRKLADELSLPMVVHAPRCKLPLEEVLSYFKKGDVLAHTFAGLEPGMRIVDENGKLKSCVREAMDRGVVFDLSHGTNQYNFRVAEQAWADGFLPAVISSDLHHSNINGPVHNLGTILTKIHGLTGLSWLEILRRTTVAPAELLHLEDKELEVKTGMPADLTVFRLEKGDFEYIDSFKETRIYHERITAMYACVGNKVYYSKDCEKEF